MGTRRWLWRAVAPAAGLLLTSQVIFGAEAAGAVPSQAAASARAPSYAHQLGQVGGCGRYARPTITGIRVAVASGAGSQARRPPEIAGAPPHPPRLQDSGSDGIVVAAIGTGLTGGGWLLMLLTSRRLRRRSR